MASGVHLLMQDTNNLNFAGRDSIDEQVPPCHRTTVMSAAVTLRWPGRGESCETRDDCVDIGEICVCTLKAPFSRTEKPYPEKIAARG